MNMQIVKFNHISFAIRRNNPNDLEVINEVVSTDSYKLTQMKARGFNPKFILDAGGHIGSFGLFAKKLWPDATIVAIECVKENADLYEASIQANGYQDMHVIRKAINYDPTRPYFLNFKEGATGGGFFIEPDKVAERLKDPNCYIDETVTCDTLENILAPFHFESIDLAKWDCEGGERQAFLKMSDELFNKMKYLVGEYHGFNNGEGFIRDFMGRFVNHDIYIPEEFIKTHFIGLFFATPKGK